MQKFIYVFDQEAKELLLARGYTLLSTEPKGTCSVFLRPESDNFSLDEIPCVLSDRLTFTQTR